MTAAALAVTAQPAGASSHRPCGVDKHSTIAGVEKVGTATATVGADGIKLTTAKSTNAEPYWYLGKIGAGNPQRQVRTEWDVMNGPLWTSSTTITGLPKTAGGPTTLTFAQVVAANPKMTVTGIGFGLGTFNAGVTAILDEQRFATKLSCTDHQWSTGFGTGTWWPGWQR